MSANQLSEQDERELFVTCVHEVGGHELAADHFGLRPECFVSGPGDAVCLHDRAPAFEEAVVSIAGILAEDMMNARSSHRVLPKVKLPLRADRLFDWFKVVEANSYFLLSDEDRSGWLRCPRYTVVCRAWEIIDAHGKDAIDYLANSAVREFKARKGVRSFAAFRNRVVAERIP